MSEDFFIKQSESHLATIARLFAMDGATKEVAVLANSVSLVAQTDYDNWNNGTNLYTLYLEISIPFYVQIQSDLEQIQTNICNKLNQIIPNDIDCLIIFISSLARIIFSPI